MTKEAFDQEVQKQILAFEGNLLIEKLRERTLQVEDYQSLLARLFHQVRSSSTTFSLAGAALPDRHWRAKAYLFQHAADESSHWQWILDDLRATLYVGPMPTSVPPSVPTAAYIGYNYFVSSTLPLGRLAIATVLEGIGGAFGAKYAKETASLLQLYPTQMKFFAGHGESDTVHSEELARILCSEVESDDDWLELTHIARTAGQLYSQIYNFGA